MLPARSCMLLLVLWGLMWPAVLRGQGAAAPPRNVDDIFALLSHYTDNPESEKRRQLGIAEQSPPKTGDRSALARFYRNRANAASSVGRNVQYMTDLQQALELEPARNYRYYRDRYLLASREFSSGSYQRALGSFGETVRSTPKNLIGQRIVAHDSIAAIHRTLGDWQAAREELVKAEQVFSERTQTRLYEQNRLALIERARAAQLESEGKFAQADPVRRRALAAIEEDLPINRQRIDQGLSTGTQNEAEASHEIFLLELAANLRQQGKLVEAEGVARTTFTKALARVQRRYHNRTGYVVSELAEIVIQQGRYREAERLATAAIDIFERSAVDAQSRDQISARKRLGMALVGQELWLRAIAEFETLAEHIRKDNYLASRYPLAHIDWGLALVKSGQAQKAVPMLDVLTNTTSARLGDAADETAQTRGTLAMALAASGNRGRALNDFRRALPVLLAHTGGAVRATRLRYILEAYIELLIGQPQPGVEAIAESFRVADAARGSSVQRALFESAVRASISDSELAAIVRKAQDARVRLGVLTSLLGRLLNAPAGDQLPRVIAGIRTEIEMLRAQRVVLKSEIDKRFPSYANLVDPKPVTLHETQAALKPGEALISIYVGQDKTYVWAIPAQGSPAFASIAIGDTALTESVTQLRKALDIGNRAIELFPKFDTVIAHKLYSELLKPVEAGWKQATSLIIVPHRALAQVPFSLLVTAPAEVAADALARFDGYRGVPWLLRNASVNQLPSVNALTTLRSLPAATVGRDEFIGFGDPYFSKTQQVLAEETQKIQVAALGSTFRNLQIGAVALPIAGDSGGEGGSVLRNVPQIANSATLAQLARLPETADEIRGIAQALKADMINDVFLGVRANENNVKSAYLSNRKVIAFATHGLVPGDLNGLDQPALALTAPEVAGIDGDGLLTMEEILALKLNADWVVLSACNTGSGDGAGGEAVSGLGRAFFYAGARSLLVSNWPVETDSARILTTEVFKRVAADPKLTRADALRQTMLWLMDNAGQMGASGKMEYSYAHPMFWAPFVLIGDGG